MNTTHAEASTRSLLRAQHTHPGTPRLRQKPVQDAPPPGCAAITLAARCRGSDGLETQARMAETFTLLQS